MVAALRRKKWRLSSAKMVSTGHDSAKRHCSPPLCGREAVKFRWGFVACSGRSGRGECGFFRWYCCAFAVLNILMGVLAGQVQATMLAGDGLAARTGTPFWRWMPLPMQNCNPGCALDKKHLHALLERRVIIPCRHCVLWCTPIDEMSIVNPGQRQPTSNDLWAPDPGSVPNIDPLLQFPASSNEPTITIAGNGVQTEHTPRAMQSYATRNQHPLGNHDASGILSAHYGSRVIQCSPPSGVIGASYCRIGAQYAYCGNQRNDEGIWFGSGHNLNGSMVIANNYGDSMQGGNYLDRHREEDSMSANGGGKYNGTMNMGQTDEWGLWVPFSLQQSMGQVDGWGRWVPSYTVSTGVNSAGSGNTVRHIPESAERFRIESPSVLCIATDPAYKSNVRVGGERDWAASKMGATQDNGTVARKQERPDASGTKIDRTVPAGRNNLSNDTRSSGDDDADNFSKNESTMLNDGKDYDDSSLDDGNGADKSITRKGVDNYDSGHSHNSALLPVGTLVSRKHTSTSTSLEDDITHCTVSNNNVTLPKADNNLDDTRFMSDIDVSTPPPVETADKQVATNLSDGVCPMSNYREALSDNSNGGEEFKRFGLNSLEELETARMVYNQALQNVTMVPFQTVKGTWNSNRRRPPVRLPKIVMSLTQNNRKTTRYVRQMAQIHGEGSHKSRKTIRDTPQAEEKQKGVNVSHEKHNNLRNAVGTTEPVTENLELPKPTDKGTDRHVVHGEKKRIPHSEDEDMALVTVHGWEGKQWFLSKGLTAGQLRERVASAGWTYALHNPLRNRAGILVPDDIVVADMGNDVTLVVTGRLRGGSSENVMAKLRREFEKLEAAKRDEAGVSPAMAATAARRASKELNEKRAAQAARDKIERDRRETSRIQQHGRTMERAMTLEKDDHVLMNLELHVETKQKALNTLEIVLKPFKSAVQGSGPLESSLKILACLLRGKLLSEVDEWPQRTVALATHHQSFRAPGDKVTLSIQIAARDNSVVQESITSKKIEELVRTAILPGVTLDSCGITAIDNAIPKERMPQRCFIQSPKRDQLTASPARFLFTVLVEMSDAEAPSLYKTLHNNRGPWQIGSVSYQLSLTAAARNTVVLVPEMAQTLNRLAWQLDSLGLGEPEIEDILLNCLRPGLQEMGIGSVEIVGVSISGWKRHNHNGARMPVRLSVASLGTIGQVKDGMAAELAIIVASPRAKQTLLTSTITLAVEIPPLEQIVLKPQEPHSVEDMSSTVGEEAATERARQAILTRNNALTEWTDNLAPLVQAGEYVDAMKMIEATLQFQEHLFRWPLAAKRQAVPILKGWLEDLNKITVGVRSMAHKQQQILDGIQAFRLSGQNQWAQVSKVRLVCVLPDAAKGQSVTIKSLVDGKRGDQALTFNGRLRECLSHSVEQAGIEDFDLVESQMVLTKGSWGKRVEWGEGDSILIFTTTEGVQTIRNLAMRDQQQEGMVSNSRGGPRVFIPLFGVDRSQLSGFTIKPRLHAVVRFMKDQQVHEGNSETNLDQKLIHILEDGHIIVRPTRDGLGNAISERTVLSQLHNAPADKPFDVRNLHQQMGLPAAECESVIGTLERLGVEGTVCTITYSGDEGDGVAYILTRLETDISALMESREDELRPLWGKDMQEYVWVTVQHFFTQSLAQGLIDWGAAWIPLADLPPGGYQPISPRGLHWEVGQPVGTEITCNKLKALLRQKRTLMRAELQACEVGSLPEKCFIKVDGGILKPVGAQGPEETAVLAAKHSWTALVPDSPLFTRGDLRERVMARMLGCMTSGQKEADAEYDRKRKDLTLPEATHGTMKVIQMTTDHAALVRADCPYKEVIGRAKLSPAERIVLNKLPFTEEEVQRGETALLQALDGHAGGVWLKGRWEELTIDNQLHGHESQALQAGFHSLLRGLPPSTKQLIRHLPHFQKTVQQWLDTDTAIKLTHNLDGSLLLVPPVLVYGRRPSAQLFFALPKSIPFKAAGVRVGWGEHFGQAIEERVRSSQMDSLARRLSMNQLVFIPGAVLQSRNPNDSPLNLPDLPEDLPPTIPEGIDINETHVALGSSVRGLEVVAEQLANFDYGWRQGWHGVLCVPPTSSVMKFDHRDVRLLQWDPNTQSIGALEELMPLDDSSTVNEWLLSKMPVLVPDYTTARIQAQPLVRSPSPSHNEARAHSLCLWNKGVPEYCKEVPGYLPTTIILALNSLLEQQDIAPHSIPPNDLLLLTLEGTVVDENTLEEINKELKKRSRGDSLDGSGSKGSDKASGATSTTLQGVEKNTQAGAASTSVQPISAEGAGKELTGGGKRGKVGGNKTGAAGNVSGGGAS